MSEDNGTMQPSPDAEVVIDFRSFLTWVATTLVLYGFLSGAMIWLLPFGLLSQYSVIVHSVIGFVSLLPVGWTIYLHWQRRSPVTAPAARPVAYVASFLLATALLTGAIIVLQATLGTWVTPILRTVHLVAGLALGAAIVLHLFPILSRYRGVPGTARRAARRRFAGAGFAGVAAILALTGLLAASNDDADERFRAFGDSYEWRFGEDRPFWPSRARIENPPWERELQAGLRAMLSDEEFSNYAVISADWGNVDAGFLTAMQQGLAGLDLGDDRQQAVERLLDAAREDLASSGAIVPDAMTGSASCGASGCHQQIYEEWLPSAHGFSATDPLFLGVQGMLAESRGAAETRACAGCHDPVALLSGTRDGSDISGDSLVHFEGNSCLVCHRTVATDSEGNGGYVLGLPDRYLWEGSEAPVATAFNRFLIRSYPEKHVETFKRPLYKDSEFCAACHKQTPLPGIDTSAGLAQEQNEYDSWKSSRWYHPEDESRNVECRECHMPLVDSSDPASGDDVDPYRSPGDGKHRSHRMLASNMYIPAVMDIPGGDEQAELTIAWLRGEIEVPEIEYKWTTGPVVELDILAPDEIKPGELVNLKLHMYNNKTGHDFPAGPLDVLESWVEVTVEDNLGNVLMQLGEERNVNPSIDAPVVYKADWYDRQGLPVERHNLWDVVGASYKRTIASGADDLVDVPFRCPGIARPRVSDSVSEDGPGERNSDVVFSFENEELTELRVTARLLFRKANPRFLAMAYDLEDPIEAPVIELNRATHTIRVVGR